MEYQLELKQIVDYPRCRIYREFVRRLMNDPNFRTHGSSYLYYYIVLCSYANFRSSYRKMDGITYLVSPGEWSHTTGTVILVPNQIPAPGHQQFWTFCSPRITSPIPAWTGTGSSNFIYLIGKPIILLLSTTTHARRMLAFSFSRYRLFMNW